MTREEVRDLLLWHAGRYPLLQCTDAVKLLYQGEFGGGHLIQNEDSCLARLRAEYAATEQSGSLPLTEELGSGTVRVHLAALDRHGLDPEELGRCFIRSAAVSRGSLAGFQEKLALLRQLTREGCFPFSPEQLEEYLTRYAASGYPAVSHSEIYRQHYAPAYRVLQRQDLPEEFR